MRKTAQRVGLAIAGFVVAAGCGSSSSGSPATANGAAGGVPTCSSLVGKTLTRAIADASCTDQGSIQGEAELPCTQGTMVAFGNVAGGYIGKPVKTGNFANWTGCTPK